MNKVLLLLFTSILLSGCSKLGEVVECINQNTHNKYEVIVIGETNKRIMVEKTDGKINIYEKSERNSRSNCSKTREEIPPIMLSGYENYSGHFNK